MNQRITNALVDMGLFTKEEIEIHGEKIKETYVYKKVELEFNVLDSYSTLKQVLEANNEEISEYKGVGL